MKSIGVKLGIDKKKLHPHNIRHFFALRYLEINGRTSITELSNILGHWSIEVTKIYLKKPLSTIRNLMTLDGLNIKIAS